MSAVRRNDRRANRNNLASPYARPSKSSKVLTSKKSFWSLSGLINFLNPFGGDSEPEDSDVSGLSDGEIEQGPPPRRFSPPPPFPPPPPPQQQLSPNSPRLSARNGPTATLSHAQQASQSHPFSLHSPSPSATSSGSSLAKNLEPVTRFLVEKAGQPLNDFEAAGIVDYIQKSVQGSTVPDKPEPFRFSVSPSRGASPTQSQGIGGMETPRKTLPRNPNGVYRWQGAGSARPRNRYQSPGFAPRPQQHRIKLSPPKTPLTTDTKRRRVGDEAESSTPQKPAVPSTSTINFPSLVPESPTSPFHHAAGPSGILLNVKSPVHAPAQPVTPKANVPQPRLRTSGLVMKPTTPAIPSPLRQAWKESDSPPQASPPTRPTRAADFMTELIKEVTPTKKPDVSNPYQTASPVKPPAPVRKPVNKRPKPTPKPTEKPKEQEPEVSAQAVIEATVPRGIKRSRPLEIEKPSHRQEAEVSDSGPFASILNGPSHPLSTLDVVEILEEDESPSKRRRTPPARPLPLVQESDDAPKTVVHPAEVIEPADDNGHINGKAVSPPQGTLSPPTGTKTVFGALKTSAPKEPSKLRYSFHADKVEVKNVNTDAVPAPSPTSFLEPPAAIPTKAKLSPKEEALAMSVDELPKYIFSTATISPSHAGPSMYAARNSVLALAVTSLPIYEFPSVNASARILNGFNWTAAGMKAPTTSTSTWTCSLCCLQNPADAKEKCTICDAPRQAPTSSSSLPPARTLAAPSPTAAVTLPPIKSFDWSAAGMAPPPKPESGTWMCSVCGLSNPASAVAKCTICDGPR